MPLGREVKRAAPCSFSLLPLNFHGTEGQGGAGFGISPPSVAALVVYACQRVGRVNGVNICFALPLLNFPGPGGDVFWKISTIGGGAFVICIPACRESERTEPFSFALAPFNFHGEEGRCFSVDLYNLRRRFRWIHTSGTGGDAR